MVESHFNEDWLESGRLLCYTSATDARIWSKACRYKRAESRARLSSEQSTKYPTKAKERAHRAQLRPAALQLTTCVDYDDKRTSPCSGDRSVAGAADRVPQSRVFSICCPVLFFSGVFKKKIDANRQKEQWIFDLIRGTQNTSEEVHIDRPTWMLVQGRSHVKDTNRYLVIFKNEKLETIRDLRQEHVAMLKQMQKTVRRWLAAKEAKHGQYKLYFHYLPSVFQLHLHVCCSPPVDSARRQYLPGVIRNLEFKDTWYRDALMMFSCGRSAFGPKGRADENFDAHKTKLVRI